MIKKIICSIMIMLLFVTSICVITVSASDDVCPDLPDGGPHVPFDDKTYTYDRDTYCYTNNPWCINCGMHIWGEQTYSHHFVNGVCDQCDVREVECLHEAFAQSRNDFTYDKNDFCHMVYENCVECGYCWDFWTELHNWKNGKCEHCDISDGSVTECQHSWFVGVCDKCGAEHTEHNFVFSQKVDSGTENLCYINIEECSVCGKQRSTEITEHSYSNGECTECGYKLPECQHSWIVGVCDKCGAEHTEHEFHFERKVIVGYEYLCYERIEACIVCGREIGFEVSKHSYLNGECTECGYGDTVAECEHFWTTNKGAFTNDVNTYCYKISKFCTKCGLETDGIFKYHSFNGVSCVECGVALEVDNGNGSYLEGYKQAIEDMKINPFEGAFVNIVLSNGKYDKYITLKVDSYINSTNGYYRFNISNLYNQEIKQYINEVGGIEKLIITIEFPFAVQYNVAFADVTCAYTHVNYLTSRPAFVRFKSANSDNKAVWLEGKMSENESAVSGIFSATCDDLNNGALINGLELEYVQLSNMLDIQEVLMNGQVELRLFTLGEGLHLASYNAGYSEGNEDGYTDGYNKGFYKGKDIGFDLGLEASDGAFENLFYSLFNAEVSIFRNILGFELFGINIAGLLATIFSIVIIAFVIKKVA